MLKLPTDAGEFLRDETEGFAAVAAVLWTEREALEHVLFKLVEEQLVLTAGATRWLNRADAEVRAALEPIRTGEVVRAAEVDALAARLGVSPDTTLAQLAEIAPEPWSMVLTEHRAALRSLVAEIETVTAENRRLLQAGAGAIRDTLEHLGATVAGYNSDGGAVNFASPAGRPFLLDEQA